MNFNSTTYYTLQSLPSLLLVAFITPSVTYTIADMERIVQQENLDLITTISMTRNNILWVGAYMASLVESENE